MTGDGGWGWDGSHIATYGVPLDRPSLFTNSDSNDELIVRGFGGTRVDSREAEQRSSSLVQARLPPWSFVRIL